ncbi:hypothetical protein [Paraglaciecola aestuariivivens]
MSVSFFKELKRRNVFKVASVYLITAWLVLQIISVLVPYLKLPEQFGSIVTVILIIGFPFVCIFAWAFELTPEGVKLSKDVEYHESITHETGSKINVALVVSLLLALAYIGYDKLFTYQIDESKALSIAVLPFADMSPDKSQEYFSDGIAEEILNSLARLKQLQVIARTSSFQFKDKQQDIRKIAQTLGANYVLEGSVRKDKNQLRVTAQLIEAESGIHLWSQTYDRQLSDIFSLQDELTYAITQALKLNLLPEQVKAEQGMTSNQQAYDLFLKGRDLGYQRNASALNQARDYLEQAIELDPDFALAKAQLYIVYSLGASHGDMNRQKANQSMRELFQQLLATEQEFPLKLLVFAEFLNVDESQPKLARELYDRAVQMDPSDTIIQNWRLLNLVRDGVSEMIEAREALFKVNPLDQFNLFTLIRYHTWLNQNKQANFYTQKLRESSPEHSLTALAVVDMLFWRDHQPQLALDYLEAFKGEMNTRTQQYHVELLLVTGNIDKAINKLKEYMGENPNRQQRFAANLVNLIHLLKKQAKGGVKLIDLQQKLNISDQYYTELLLHEKAMTGDWQDFVTYWDEKFTSLEFFKHFPNTTAKTTYAMLKFQMGDPQYIDQDTFSRFNITLCKESVGRRGGRCALGLYLDGERNSETLISYVKNHLENGIEHGFVGVKRYTLTGPHLFMLHDLPEFKAMANEYLDNTYRKWEKEFGTNSANLFVPVKSTKND